MGCGLSIMNNGNIQQDQELMANLNSEEESKNQNGLQLQELKLKVCTVSIGDHISPFQYYLQNHSSCCQKTLVHPDRQQFCLNYQFQKIYATLFTFKDQQKNQSLANMLENLHYQTTCRYTPLYLPTAGMTSQYFLMTKKQFIQQWNSTFEQIQTNSQIKLQKSILGFDEKVHNLEDLKIRLRRFDLICYYSILMYVYNIKIQQDSSKHEIQTKIAKYIQNNRAYDYYKFMNQKFSKNASNIQNKISKLITFIKKKQIDILFLQQLSQKTVQLIDIHNENYRISTMINCNNQELSCAILIKNSLISQLQLKNKTLTFSQLNKKYILDLAIKRENSGSSQNSKADDEIKQENPLGSLFLNNINQKKGRNLPPISEIKNIQSENKKKQSDIIESKKKITSQWARNQISYQEIFNIDYIKQFVTTIPINNQNKLTEAELIEFEGNNFQMDSAIQFVGCLILVSIQLRQIQKTSSQQGQRKPKKSPLIKLKNILKILSKRLPHHNIIVGAGITSSKTLQKDEVLDHMAKFRNKIKQQFNFVPNIHQAIEQVPYQQRHMIAKKRLKRMMEKKGLYTTLKRKSNFLLNRKQVNKQYMGADCFIISNRQIKNFVSYNCNGEVIDENSAFTNQKNYLPSTDHPFEDFFVYGQIKIKKKQVNFI